MTAIAGLINWDGAPASAPVKRALAALALHGRDGEAVWDGGDVAMGWRKTLLFAEDRYDRQPLTGGGGRFVLVADARLDNREDLGVALAIDAERASRLADSAFVMAAFEKWGERSVDHLTGSFAFAVWDRDQRRLFLARDHMGSRPLFYWRGARQCFFATMPSALFTHPDIPREIDDEGFVYRACVVPRDLHQTLYKGIDRVPVNHTVTISADGLTSDRYWVVEDMASLTFKSDDDYVEAFREIFDEAVRCRLRGLHPIGTHLSSGWDSTSVAATAARLLAERGQKLTAFTAVPPKGWQPIPVFGQIVDEGPLAATVAQLHANMDHVLIHGSGRWDFDALDRYARFYEQPRMDINNAGWWESLHLEARGRGIRVMLMGGMGNLSISYDGMALLPHLLRQGHLIALADHWAGLKRRGKRNRAIFKATVSPLLPPHIWNAILRLSGREELTDFSFGGVKPEIVQRYGFDTGQPTGPVTALTLYRADRRGIWKRTATRDISTISCGLLAAADIDLRDPTADHRVMEFCCRIPLEQFLHRGQSRWLLRRAMQGVLPQAILAEPRRGRQAADWCEAAARSADALAEELDRLSRNAKTSPIINTDVLKTLAQDWPVRAIVTNKKREAAYMSLLYTTVLGRFVRRFHGGNE